MSITFISSSTSLLNTAKTQNIACKSVRTKNKMQFNLKFNTFHFKRHESEPSSLNFFELLKKRKEKKNWLIMLIYMFCKSLCRLRVLRLNRNIIAFFLHLFWAPPNPQHAINASWNKNVIFNHKKSGSPPISTWMIFSSTTHSGWKSVSFHHRTIIILSELKWFSSLNIYMQPIKIEKKKYSFVFILTAIWRVCMNIDRFSILISLDFFYGFFVFYNLTDAAKNTKVFAIFLSVWFLFLLKLFKKSLGKYDALTKLLKISEMFYFILVKTFSFQMSERRFSQEQFYCILNCFWSWNTFSSSS